MNWNIASGTGNNFCFSIKGKNIHLYLQETACVVSSDDLQRYIQLSCEVYRLLSGLLFDVLHVYVDGCRKDVRRVIRVITLLEEVEINLKGFC